MKIPYEHTARDCNILLLQSKNLLNIAQYAAIPRQIVHVSNIVLMITGMLKLYIIGKRSISLPPK